MTSNVGHLANYFCGLPSASSIYRCQDSTTPGETATGSCFECRCVLQVLCKRTSNLTADSILESFCQSAKPYDPVAQFSSPYTPWHLPPVNNCLQVGVQYSGQATPAHDHIQYFSCKGLKDFLQEVRTLPAAESGWKWLTFSWLASYLAQQCRHVVQCAGNRLPAQHSWSLRRKVVVVTVNTQQTAQDWSEGKRSIGICARQLVEHGCQCLFNRSSAFIAMDQAAFHIA
jgi:hypothetical protein